MSLSAKDIHHIAGLAKLKLTDKEVVQYRREISGIVRYVHHFAEANVGKEDITASLSHNENSLRPDVAEKWNREEHDQTLKTAAKRKGSYICAPRVFE